MSGTYMDIPTITILSSSSNWINLLYIIHLVCNSESLITFSIVRLKSIQDKASLTLNPTDISDGCDKL
jgi:hypothetical protein